MEDGWMMKKKKMKENEYQNICPGFLRIDIHNYSCVIGRLQVSESVGSLQ